MADQSEGEQANPTIQAEQMLRRLNEEWVEALTRQDIATLNRLMDDRCIFTDALSGDDKAQFLADIASGDLRVNSLKRDNVEIRVYGSTGVMTALDTADWIYQGRQMQGHYRTTHVYAARAGNWQIVAIQSSHIAS